MGGRIDDAVLEDILGRIDIVELISGYLPLKKAGRNFRALCPFHHEKSPSFMVSPDRQIYHCFGCGESGNAFKFLMRHERMEFREAVEMLAKKAGVALPVDQPRDPAAESLITSLFAANELSAKFYSANLNGPPGEKARKYLLSRGIKPETAQEFRLGYSLERWDGLINFLRGKNITLSVMEKSGLVLARSSGGYYDRFRDRVMFPIMDIKSRPLGFGARVLDKETPNSPKYMNSPETQIYTKGRNLFGLQLSKDFIRQADCAVIVEGNLDMIMPYQEGVRNIVASLGTALTAEQVRLLKRYTRNVVMVYDPDDAGQAAALRSLDIFIEEEMQVRVVTLPEKLDPDLFVRKYGARSFQDQIAGAKNLFDYKLDILKGRYGVREAESKAKISAEMLLLVNKFQNAVLRSEYLKKLAEELKVEEPVLREELKKLKPEQQVRPALKSIPAQPGMNATEQLLVKLMLEESELINRLRGSIEPGDFQDERACRIVSVLFDLVSQGKPVVPGALVNYLDDDASLKCICESAFLPEVSPEKKDEVINDCVTRLKNEKAKLLRKNLHERIKNAQASGDDDLVSKLMREFHELIKTR